MAAALMLESSLCVCNMRGWFCGWRSVCISDSGGGSSAFIMSYFQKFTCDNIAIQKKKWLSLFSGTDLTLEHPFPPMVEETLGNHLLWNKAFTLQVNIHGQCEVQTPCQGCFLLPNTASACRGHLSSLVALVGGEGHSSHPAGIS